MTIDPSYDLAQDMEATDYKKLDEDAKKETLTSGDRLHYMLAITTYSIIVRYRLRPI